MPDLPHSASLRNGRWSEPGAGYLITHCRAPGLTLNLTDPAAADIIIRSIRWHQEQLSTHLLAFVVMPDHVHWVFILGESRSLDQVLKGFASVTSRQIIQAYGLTPHVVWQEEYHDHRLRSEEKTWAKVEYVHANPVRRGLCAGAEDWPWSTANPRFKGWVEEGFLAR